MFNWTKLVDTAFGFTNTDAKTLDKISWGALGVETISAISCIVGSVKDNKELVYASDIVGGVADIVFRVSDLGCHVKRFNSK